MTYVWNRDLKQVLQERLFDLIGIPAERWDWLPGGHVKDQKYFYPEIPDSYTYLDPPYEIDGNIVRSGPGWVVISASDLSRFGHLNATRGIWKGQQIIEAAYFEKDSARGLEGSFMWLGEEVGELARTLNSGDPNSAEEQAEFADVLAWLATLANITEVDLSKAIHDKYIENGGPPGTK